MTLKELLQDNENAILQRWFDDAMGTYPDMAVAAFSRQKDPFANPVGHSLRVGTQGIFATLLEGPDDAKIRECLLEIIRIRAVQEISPAAAVGFVFGLRRAIRAELAPAINDAALSSELAKIEDQIECIALAAFNIYVECREQVYELRVNEVKRQVSWVVDKMNGHDPEPAPRAADSSEGV